MSSDFSSNVFINWFSSPSLICKALAHFQEWVYIYPFDFPDKIPRSSNSVEHLLYYARNKDNQDILYIHSVLPLKTFLISNELPLILLIFLSRRSLQLFLELSMNKRQPLGPKGILISLNKSFISLIKFFVFVKNV